MRLLALALTASTLGVMVPILRDAEVIDTEFGQLAIMAGSVGEFGALILLTILFSAQPEPTWEQVAYVAVLGAASFAGAYGLRRLWRSPYLRRAFLATDQSTSQLRVRGGFVVLLVFSALAHRFGVDALLGAFVGGVVLNVADSDDRPTQERYQGKLHAIGYGFLVPVFFIVTGVTFDVRALFASTSSLALVPAIVVAILLARGLPALVYRRKLGTRPALAAGFLQATTLTFPVVVAEVGQSLNLLSAAAAAALVGAALLSVLLFPAAALRCGRGRRRARALPPLALVTSRWSRRTRRPDRALAGTGYCQNRDPAGRGCGARGCGAPRSDPRDPGTTGSGSSRPPGPVRAGMAAAWSALAPAR